MLSKSELKFIKSLKIKKYRVREKRFLVEGAKNVQELLNSNFEIDLLVGSEHFLSNNEKKSKDIRTEVVSEGILSSIGNFVNNNTALAVVKNKDRKEEIDFSKQVFLLDGVGDPGNLGTIIRTLDWFGFNQIVCSTNSAELYNPKVISSTMGSFIRVKVWYKDLIEVIKQSSLPTYGAEMNGESLLESTIPIPSIIVMGSESQGISKQVKATIKESITIPRFGIAESLNVGVATGIIASQLRKL